MRLIMMGTGGFALPTFQALLASSHQVVGLVTQPDRDVGKERGSTRQIGPGMKEFARMHKVPVLQPESINTADGVAAMAAWRPDLLVVAAFGQILSKEVLAVAKEGGINVHGSLLPRYRGAAPVAWAIYNGETQTGVTIIKMSVHLDAGDMLAQQTVAIGPEETAGELEARLAPLGAQLALQVVEQIAAGTARGVKQDKLLATKAPKLTKEHGVIHWARPAQAVCDHIRAMQPWPTAYTYLHVPGKSPLRLLIAKAKPASATLLTIGTPGHAVDSNGLRLLAQTGQAEWVEILELQPAGKRRMSGAEFLRGHPLPPGAWLGPETP